jgi:hypothetical protein
MGGSIKDDATPEEGRCGDDADAVAGRLRAEMHIAVDSVRARLPQAFPRWQQRRSDAADAATPDRRQ